MRKFLFKYMEGLVAFYMDFLELCRSRYSERRFSDKVVEEEKIEVILEAARIAPSGHNYQPWKFYVTKSKEGLEKLRSVTRMTFGAPLVVLAGYNIDEAWKTDNDRYYPNYNDGETSCAIAMTMMMMAATDLGLKTCWARDYDSQDLIDLFNIPEEIRLVGLLSIGYESDRSRPSPLNSDRKSLEEIVEYL